MGSTSSRYQFAKTRRCSREFTICTFPLLARRLILLIAIEQRATLGDICICKMSNHLDILQEARNRLEQCEKLDRTVPIDLPEMDQQQSFLKWAHVQIRAGVSFLLRLISNL